MKRKIFFTTILLLVFALCLGACGILPTKPTTCEHEMTTHQATAATCTTNGNKEYWQCTKCNKYFSDENGITEITLESTTIAALEHINKNDDCKCDVCDAETHPEEVIAAVEPTCTETGLAEGKKCPTCGKILQEQPVVAALGHSYDTDVCDRCNKEIVFSEGLHFAFNKDKTGYFVIGLDTCMDTDIIIPATHKSLPIIGIGEMAFYWCQSLTSISMPTSVTTINENAFENCSNLTSITFGDNSKLTSIGDHAFMSCENLTSITIPESVTSIGSAAFLGCEKLQYNEYENALYLGNNSTPFWALIDTINLSITSCSINENTKVIGDKALYYCHKLTSITIPESVRNIGVGAFSSCSGLESIAVASGNSNYRSEGNCLIENATNTLIAGCKNSFIPNSVTSIGDRAFYDCSSLTSITIPESVTEIGSNAFQWCYRLTSITIPESVTFIGSDAFDDCDKLKYNEHDNALYLGNSSNPFVVLVNAKDDEITACSIHENTKIIYDSAFNGCSNLTSVNISDRVTYIGSYAFYNCSSLTSINIPNSVTSIGIDAFAACSSLTYITISDNLTNIGYGMFSDCVSLTDITIPDSVNTIGSYAFYNCPKLTSVTFINTNGWQSAGDNISAIDLADPVTAAMYLKSTYDDFYWHRS